MNIAKPRQQQSREFQFTTVTYDGVKIIKSVVQITKEEQMMKMVRCVTEIKIL